MIRASDSALNADVQIENAARAIGRSPQRQAVFDAIQRGKKSVKTISEVVAITNLTHKQVLEAGKALARHGVVTQQKQGRETAYGKNDLLQGQKRRIRALVRTRSVGSGRVPLAKGNRTTAGGTAPLAPQPVQQARSPTWGDRFDRAITSDPLRETSRNLFRQRHYARAVEEAFKCLNNTVKQKSGLVAYDGAQMMQAAFSPKEPLLRLNTLESQSDKDEQQGYMLIYAGAMTGIRNPRAHEHELQDPPEVALELLILANHLMRRLNAATRGGRRTKRP